MEEVDWGVVEAAAHRAVYERAVAYWIPANVLCGGDRLRQERMATAWADMSAPFIVDCIRAELRKAPEGPALESRP